ncbi:MAG: M48 family metallopeptidase [Phycisphaerales bacterium]|nr:M48 family metallopeptidase [Phycisphaerales bacterium]
MVDFFEQQAAARKRTTLCVALYGAAVVAVTLCVVPVLVLTGLYLTAAVEPRGDRASAVARTFQGALHDPVATFSHGPNLVILIGALVATLSLILGASLVRYVSLRRGGAVVAEGLGARLVSPGTADLDERRLLNVVEEMALAASVPVPSVYIMEREDGVNAFAAGHSPSDAVVAVTRGTLQRLTREQLQGVVAHEFSHILNGDMRLNLRLMGLLYGIVCVGLLGHVLLRTGGSRRNNALPLAGLLLIVIGASGVLCARLIKAMISRQREYLADASAVQFTRSPEGIGGALRVIGGTGKQGRLDSGKASECSHMMFVSCVNSWMGGALATHPPLEDRIRRVDPQWDGSFLRGRDTSAPADRSTGGDEGQSGAGSARTVHGVPLAAVGLAGLAAAAASAKTGGKTGLLLAGELSAQQVFERVGAARAALAAIPERLRQLAREPFTARALLLAMLLDADTAISEAQLGSIAALLGGPTAQNTRVLAKELARNDRSIRLPLIDLSMAALATLSPEQYRAFRAAVTSTINADNRVDLFEVCLEQILIKHLDRRHLDARPVPVQYYALHRLGEPVAALFWAVAMAGTTDPAEAEKSVNAALARFSLSPVGRRAAADLPAEAIVNALGVMRSVAPKLRSRVLTACAELAGADGQIDPQESELLQAIADALDLPLALQVTAR